MNTNVKIFLSVIAVLIVGTVVTAVIRSSSESAMVVPGQYDSFAQCLKDEGVTFYGAFWCPHCQAQKKIFGTSAKLLPYVECSTLDGAGQLPVCTEKNITSYPTWEFADGSRLSAELSLLQLSEKTSCPLLSESETENVAQ